MPPLRLEFFLSSDSYSGASGQVVWVGQHFEQSELDAIRDGVLQERLTDSAVVESLGDDMKALAATSMAIDFVEAILASDPLPLNWQIGEALAESILQVNHSAIWPWNSARDRKTPKASLPGADIVGFSIEIEEAVFLFGEVKTSSDLNNPPGVMYGRGGMVHQLDDLAARLDVQFALLRWLSARCTGTVYADFYEQALKRFVNSEGKDVRLVGCLMRDTSPHDGDLTARAEALALTVTAPTQVSLFAWYVDMKCSSWPEWAKIPSNE